MSMCPGDRGLIPAETVAVVRAACPKGTRVTRVRDVLGPVFEDGQFAEWFAAEGRGRWPPGWSLWSACCSRWRI